MGKKHLLLGSTVGFLVLYGVATAVLGTPPDDKDSGAVVAAWFRDNGSHVRWWLWCLTLAVPLFALFVVLVRQHLPKPHSDVFLFGGITFAATTALQGWFWAGMAWHATTLEPATARVLYDISSYWGPVLIGSTVLMLGPIALLGLRGEAGIPRWVGILSALALVEQLVETITIVGTKGFIAPGGPMNVIVGAAATLVAWLCLAIALARTAPATP